MIRIRLAGRPGMTLPEVLTALVIMGIIGGAVTGVFVSQSQFHSQQETASAARNVTRGAVNILLSDLRTVARGSVEAASTSAITVHVPVAFGIICGHEGSGSTAFTVVSRLPADTTMFNAAGAENSYSGHAWLHRRTQAWSAMVAATQNPQAHTGTNYCANATTLMPDGTSVTAPIRVLTAAQGGGVFRLRPRLDNGGVPAPVGSTVAMFHRVTYEFKPSALVPGRVGLYRTMGTVEEEIAAPFAATARFRFYNNDNLTSQGPVPSPLTNITGFEVVLDARSERPSANGSFPVMPYSTSVFLRNR